jgi:HEPN domain-containing protein
MNRADLQKLANTRIREARVLFGAGEYSGAYYLAGYAVECALKACIAKDVKRFDFPNKNVQKIFTHKLNELIVLSGLKDELHSATRSNLKFSAGWDLVEKWTEESRYSVRTKDDAEAIIEAITRTKDGVLPWIKRRW